MTPPRNRSVPYHGPHVVLSFEEAQLMQQLIPITSRYDDVRTKFEVAIGKDPRFRKPTP